METKGNSWPKTIAFIAWLRTEPTGTGKYIFSFSKIIEVLKDNLDRSANIFTTIQHNQISRYQILL